MKNFKKLLVSAMALMMAFSTVACGGGGGNPGSTSSSQGGGVSSETSSTPAEESSSEIGGNSSSSESGDSGYVPQNPYTLNLYNFTGGFGADWLYDLENRYKEERAGDTIVVNGKTYDGITFNNTEAKTTLENMIDKGETYDIWFQEQVYYNQFIGKNVMKDMTDVLTSENPYEPGKTLLGKLSAEQQDYYNRDGKYYGVPHYAGYVGIVYNKKMFDDYKAYFYKGYDKELLTTAPGECMVISLTEPRTAGPDGIEGTIDDGLPTTYEEFYALCTILAETNKPISWSGKHRHGYLGWFLQSLSGSNEALDQAVLNYSFDGTLNSLIAVEEDALGTVTITDLPDVEINAENVKADGWKVAQQRGKYYALDFLETIVDYEWYTKNSFIDTDEQTAAQINFVEGKAEDPTERAAMLIDGSWWEMEAKSSFLALEQGGVANPKDNFGWFPLPAIDEAGAAARAAALTDDDATTKGYNLTDVMNSLCFIGAQVSDDVYAIAKDFIQFAYTDESLAQFSIITDTTKAVQYTMTDAQKGQMSAYGRSLLDMQEKANIVAAFSKNEFFQKNEQKLVDYKTLFDAKLNGKISQIPVNECKRDTSATTYFNGLIEAYKDKWKTVN